MDYPLYGSLPSSSPAPLAPDAPQLAPLPSGASALLAQGPDTHSALFSGIQSGNQSANKLSSDLSQIEARKQAQFQQTYNRSDAAAARAAEAQAGVGDAWARGLGNMAGNYFQGEQNQKIASAAEEARKYQLEQRALAAQELLEKNAAAGPSIDWADKAAEWSDTGYFDGVPMDAAGVRAKLKELTDSLPVSEQIKEGFYNAGEESMSPGRTRQRGEMVDIQHKQMTGQVELAKINAKFQIAQSQARNVGIAGVSPLLADAADVMSKIDPSLPQWAKQEVANSLLEQIMPTIQNAPVLAQEHIAAEDAAAAYKDEMENGSHNPEQAQARANLTYNNAAGKNVDLNNYLKVANPDHLAIGIANQARGAQEMTLAGDRETTAWLNTVQPPGAPAPTNAQIVAAMGNTPIAVFYARNKDMLARSGNTAILNDIRNMAEGSTKQTDIAIRKQKLMLDLSYANQLAGARTTVNDLITQGKVKAQVDGPDGKPIKLVDPATGLLNPKAIDPETHQLYTMFLMDPMGNTHILGNSDYRTMTGHTAINYNNNINKAAADLAATVQEEKDNLMQHHLMDDTKPNAPVPGVQTVEQIMKAMRSNGQNFLQADPKTYTYDGRDLPQFATKVNPTGVVTPSKAVSVPARKQIPADTRNIKIPYTQQERVQLQSQLGSRYPALTPAKASVIIDSVKDIWGTYSPYWAHAMADVMASEGTTNFNPAQPNLKGSGAIGLIQMTGVAINEMRMNGLIPKGMDNSEYKEYMKKMSFEKQMKETVVPYFKMHMANPRIGVHNREDLAAVVFAPASLGRNGIRNGNTQLTGSSAYLPGNDFKNPSNMQGKVNQMLRNVSPYGPSGDPKNMGLPQGIGGSFTSGLTIQPRNRSIGQ